MFSPASAPMWPRTPARGTSGQPRWELARTIPGATGDNGTLTDAFCAQVLRAVNVLVSGGTLLKTSSGVKARYMTPAVRKARKEAAERWAAEREIEHEQWRDAKMRLAALHYLDTSTSDTMIRLDLADWLSILQKLEDAGRTETR